MEYRNHIIGGIFCILVLSKFLVEEKMAAISTSQSNFVKSLDLGYLLDDKFDYGDGVETKVWFYPLNHVQMITERLMKNVNTMILLISPLGLPVKPLQCCI